VASLRPNGHPRQLVLDGVRCTGWGDVHMIGYCADYLWYTRWPAYKAEVTVDVRRVYTRSRDSAECTLLAVGDYIYNTILYHCSI
jgi:hypothetical protein